MLSSSDKIMSGKYEAIGRLQAEIDLFDDSNRTKEIVEEMAVDNHLDLIEEEVCTYAGDGSGIKDELVLKSQLIDEVSVQPQLTESQIKFKALDLDENKIVTLKQSQPHSQSEMLSVKSSSAIKRSASQNLHGNQQSKKPLLTKVMVNTLPSTSTGRSTQKILLNVPTRQRPQLVSTRTITLTQARQMGLLTPGRQLQPVTSNLSTTQNKNTVANQIAGFMTKGTTSILKPYVPIKILPAPPLITTKSPMMQQQKIFIRQSDVFKQRTLVSTSNGGNQFIKLPSIISQSSSPVSTIQQVASGIQQVILNKPVQYITLVPKTSTSSLSAPTVSVVTTTVAATSLPEQPQIVTLSTLTPKSNIKTTTVAKTSKASNQQPVTNQTKVFTASQHTVTSSQLRPILPATKPSTSTSVESKILSSSNITSINASSSKQVSTPSKVTITEELIDDTIPVRKEDKKNTNLTTPIIPMIGKPLTSPVSTIQHIRMPTVNASTGLQLVRMPVVTSGIQQVILNKPVQYITLVPKTSTSSLSAPTVSVVTTTVAATSLPEQPQIVTLSTLTPKSNIKTTTVAKTSKASNQQPVTNQTKVFTASQHTVTSSQLRPILPATKPSTSTSVESKILSSSNITSINASSSKQVSTPSKVTITEELIDDTIPVRKEDKKNTNLTTPIIPMIGKPLTSPVSTIQHIRMPTVNASTGLQLVRMPVVTSGIQQVILNKPVQYITLVPKTSTSSLSASTVSVVTTTVAATSLPEQPQIVTLSTLTPKSNIKTTTVAKTSKASNQQPVTNQTKVFTASQHTVTSSQLRPILPATKPSTSTSVESKIPSSSNITSINASSSKQVSTPSNVTITEELIDDTIPVRKEDKKNTNLTTPIIPMIGKPLTSSVSTIQHIRMPTVNASTGLQLVRMPVVTSGIQQVILNKPVQYITLVPKTSTSSLSASTVSVVTTTGAATSLPEQPQIVTLSTLTPKSNVKTTTVAKTSIASNQQPVANQIKDFTAPQHTMTSSQLRPILPASKPSTSTSVESKIPSSSITSINASSSKHVSTPSNVTITEKLIDDTIPVRKEDKKNTNLTTPIIPMIGRPSTSTAFMLSETKPKSISDVNKTKKYCNCARTQCLKLYCDCFANGEFCYQCNCTSCYNNMEHKEDRAQAIRSVLDRNPNAFRPKIQMFKGKVEHQHTKGCNCKRSGCLKNYCECFEAQISCSQNCKCIGCRNNMNDDSHTSFGGHAESPNVDNLKSSTKTANFVTSFGSMHAANATPSQPFKFFTNDVIQATCRCLLSRGADAKKLNASPEECQRLIIKEFGQCLVKIMDLASEKSLL